MFLTDADIFSLTERLLACTLPKPAWTHAAHCAAAICLLRTHPKLDVKRDLPGIIWRYNESVGGVNSDSEGYHETITQFYIEAISDFLNHVAPDLPLAAACNQFIASEFGRKDFPFRFYSYDHLFSVIARRHWVEPDLRPLDFSGISVAS